MDLKMLFELLKEVREDQKKHGHELAKQSVYLENMDGDVRDLKTTVIRNTEDIAHHIKRTDLLQELHRDNQIKIEQNKTRIESLEEPVKAKEWIKKHIITITSLIAAIVSVAALILDTLKK